MNPGRDLIQKFFRNECNKEEAEIVDRYLRENPGKLESFMPLEDWLSESEKTLDIDVSESLLKNIRNSYQHEKRSVLRPIIYAAVAACFIGLLCIAGGNFSWLKSKETQSENTGPLWQFFNNTHQYPVQGNLSDGSVVTLYEHSSLKYLANFEKNKRELYLTGRAQFKVAKDASRPFTVFAAGISTTALGTTFSITVTSKREVTVLLKEGSVKVRSLQDTEPYRFVLLHPGEQVTVHSDHFKDYVLKTNKVKVKAGQQQKVPEKKPVQNSLVFKNEKMKNVFTRLEERFAVTIHYEKIPDLGEKLFTGSFLDTEDLEFVMRLICQLHGLTCSIEGNKVFIQ